MSEDPQPRVRVEDTTCAPEAPTSSTEFRQGSPISLAQRRALRAQRSIAKREAESEFRQHRKCLIIGLAAMLGYLRSPDTSSLSVAHRALLALQSAEFSARGEFSSAWRLWLAPLQRLAACQLRYTVSPSGRA